MARLRIEVELETDTSFAGVDSEYLSERLNDTDRAGRNCFVAEELMAVLSRLLRTEKDVAVNKFNPMFTLAIVPSLGIEIEEDEGFRLRPGDEDGETNTQG